MTNSLKKKCQICHWCHLQKKIKVVTSHIAQLLLYFSQLWLLFNKKMYIVYLKMSHHYPFYLYHVFWDFHWCQMMHLIGRKMCCLALLYIFIGAGQRLIASKIKVFVYIIYVVYCVYLLCIYKDTHIQYTFWKYVFICIYLYLHLYNLCYININMFII